MPKIIIVIDQPEDKKMTRDEFQSFADNLKRLIPNISQTACIKDSDTIDIKRDECPNDPNGFHSFRDGQDWRMNCRLCGAERK